MATRRLPPGQRPRHLSPTDRRADVRTRALKWFDEIDPGQRWEGGLLGFPMTIDRRPDGTYRATLAGLANGHTEARDFGSLDSASGWLLDVALMHDGEPDRRRDGERQAEETSPGEDVDTSGAETVDPDDLPHYIEGGDQDGRDVVREPSGD